MSLLGKIDRGVESGSRKVLDILEKLNGAFMPSSKPISDPALEEAAGPEAAARARELYQRQYNAQRAAAVQSGANVFNMDALAASGAQDAYSQNLARSAQAVQMLRDQRTKSGRLDALQKMITGIADPQKRAVAEADPEGYAAAAIKNEFAPETENFSMTAVGDGTIAILDKRKGEHKIVKDPEISAALKSGVASVQEAGGKLYVIGKGGQVINSVDVGADPKVEAAADKELRRMQVAQRRQFDALDAVKNYRAVLPMLEAAKKAPDTAAGDLSWIYTVGKILDPGSVVREGEMTLVIKSGSIMEQLLGTKRLQMEGKGRFSPERRAQLEQALQGRVDMLRQPYLQTAQQYSEYATEDGYDPKRIIGDDPLAAFDAPAPQGAGSTLEYVRDPKTGKLVRK